MTKNTISIISIIVVVVIAIVVGFILWWQLSQVSEGIQGVPVFIKQLPSKIWGTAQEKALESKLKVLEQRDDTTSAINEDLRTLEISDLDKEFKEIDDNLNQL